MSTNHERGIWTCNYGGVWIAGLIDAQISIVHQDGFGWGFRILYRDYQTKKFTGEIYESPVQRATPSERSAMSVVGFRCAHTHTYTSDEIAF